MKVNFIKTFFCFILIIAASKMLTAQLSFPNGNVLNLKTSEQYLYIETQILFNTGKFKANDYSWDKKLDSIDSKWFVTACFNGDCKNDLLQSGTFLKDFGLNDTTCFIAFHVETHEYTGTSKIIYRVFNKNNPLDSATLYFNISYSKPSGLNDLMENNLNIYPNPVTNKINIETMNINKHDSDTSATPKFIENARHATAADARRKSKVDLKTVFLLSKFIHFM